MIALRPVGRALARSWGVLLLIAAWQLWVSANGYNSIVMPRPTEVLGDLVGHPSAYLGPFASTVSNAAVGLVLGMLLGTLVAVLAWWSALLAGMLTPAALVMRSVPIVAMIPVIARLLGYGESTVLAVAVLISFFPAFVLVASGLRALPPGSEDVFMVLGARKAGRLWRLALPAAAPNLLVALRISAANCVLAALVAEFLMGTDGLGYLFQQTRNDLNMERAWGAALIATLLSVVLFLGAQRLERWGHARWR